MEKLTKKSFNNLVRELTEEIIEEEELEEFNTTASVGGSYMTPMAFDPEGQKKKKKRKIGEALDDKDLKQIQKLIRDTVGDIYRDIWLKRNSWK